jgi:hypothetical protein
MFCNGVSLRIYFAIYNYEDPPVRFVEHKRNEIELTIRE